MNFRHLFFYRKSIQINSVHKFPDLFFNIHFYIILLYYTTLIFAKQSIPFSLYQKDLYTLLFYDAFNKSCPSQPSD